MNMQPFLLGKDAAGRRLGAVGERSGQFDEGWLQSVLHAHPEILPAGAIEFVYSPMISLGREIATKAGPIDNLFISQQGYLTLVETKLWRNAEARREVVAQAMDYAHALSQWKFQDLEAASKGRGLPDGLFQAVERQLGPVQGGREFFIEAVEKNLKLGRFLVLIVGDRIRESVIEIASFVNRHPGLALNLALVELQCFHFDEKGGWPLVIVPRIVKRTEIVERSVVEVTIIEGAVPKVSVRQQKSAAASEDRRGAVLSEDAFWSLMKRQAADVVSGAQKLVEGFRNRPGVFVDPGAASLVIKFEDHESGRLVSLFHIHNKGNLGVWPQTLRRQMADIRHPPEAVEKFIVGTRKALHMPKSRTEFSQSLKVVDMPTFRAEVDGLLSALERQSDPETTE